MTRAGSILKLGLVLSIGAVAAAAGWAAVPSAERYDQVISRLETGGDLLVYVNVEDALREAVEKMIRGLKWMPDPDPDAEQFLAGLDRVAAFIEASGANDVAAFGMSSRPATNGMYAVNAFLAVDGLADPKPMWRLFGGTPPTVLKIQHFLPGSTVLARTANLDLGALWSLIETGALEIGGTNVAGAVQAATERPLGKDQATIGEVLDSLGQEIAVSLQLATNRQVAIPIGGDAGASIPEPSLLAVMAAEGDALRDALLSAVAMSGMPVVTEDAGGATLHAITLPIPLPIPLQPTITGHDGYLLCGSSPTVVKEALAAYGGANRLVEGPAFREAFQDLPRPYNGMFFIDRRLVETVVETQLTLYREFMDLPPEAEEDFKSLMLPEGEGSTAIVRVNAEDGYLLTGRTPTSGKEVLAAATVMPLAVTAAILIPALERARHQARATACRAHIEMIRSAKAQLELDQNLSDGATVSPNDLPAYLGDGLPTCPSGGAYTPGAVGEDPTCSVEGH